MEVHPYQVSEQELESHLLETKSTKVDLKELCAEQSHLTPEQQQELYYVLHKYKKVFDGSLGCYPKRKFHIELKPDAVPYHCDRPYSVPVSVREVFKKELERQVELGILERVYETEWGMPMMVIPKKMKTEKG